MSRIVDRCRWFVLFLGVLFLSGCGSDGEGEKAFLSVGTAPPGGAFFVVGGAIAQAVNGAANDLNWEVSSEATKGTQENIRRLVKGELNFALANAAISYHAVRGEGGWEQPLEIRSVMTLAPNVALFISPKSSGIASIAELKGKRVVVGPAGAGFEYFIRPILEAHGLTYDDFTPLYSTQSGAVDLLADGAADAAMLGGAVPTASITQASASQDIRFVIFDAQKREELVDRYPFFEPATIPTGTYRGQDSDFSGLNVGSMHLITSSGESEETVYQFTKLLYEHREDVVRQHPAGKAINPRVIVKRTGTPFHPGAVKYFKEIGIWPKGAGS